MTATVTSQKPSPAKEPLPPSKPDYMQRAPSILPPPTPKPPSEVRKSSPPRNERQKDSH